ncbi:MAG: tetratricopeptide repeat protein [bacterium]
MPVKPKHSLGAAAQRAARQFTDREDFVAAFRKALAAGRRDQPSVLIFYGVGGIGKSSLRRELARLFAEAPEAVTATVDFDVPGHRDEETALFVLRKALHTRNHVRFPTFDIAYATFWQKTRPQTPMNRSTLPLLEDGDMVTEMLAACGSIPFVEAVPKFAMLAARGGHALQEWWTRRGSQELRDLPALEPPQIAERLPMFWAADLRDFLSRKSRRAVLFLDTYEALAAGERTDARRHQQDAWVRELVAQLPEVLWVICGREMLRWADIDAEWADCLDQHLVGGLSGDDARRFLASCGIGEGPVQDAIVTGGQGVPYYLDLAVDAFREISDRLGRKPEPGDFGRTGREVTERFIRHLTQPEVETLKLLAVPRFWDLELFETLVREFQTGFPLTAFADLCRFSFINEEAAHGVWTMHQLMQQALRENASPELVRRVHRRILEHYTGRLKDIDIGNVTERHKGALDEGFHHGRAALPVLDFCRWLHEQAEPFYQAAQWRLLVQFYERLGRDLEAELGPDHPAVGENLDNLAMLLWRLHGDFAEAEPLARRALAISERALGAEHPQVAACLNDLASLLQDRNRTAEAESLFRRALVVLEKTLGQRHPQVAICLNNFAVLLSQQDRYAEAVPLHRRAIAIREEALGPEHPDVANNMDNLAALLGRMGKEAEAEAEALHRRALTILEKKLGLEHPRIAGVLHNLAMLLKSQKKYAEAEPLARRGLAVLEKALGPQHPNVAHLLGNLAALLYAQDRWAEAEPLARRALAIREARLGPNHPLVAVSLDVLAGLCGKTGREAEARELGARASAIRSAAQQACPQK